MCVCACMCIWRNVYAYMYVLTYFSPFDFLGAASGLELPFVADTRRAGAAVALRCSRAIMKTQVHAE